MSLAEFVDRLGRIPLGSHPGERWRYSYATDVLGRLLEVRGLLVEVALNGRIYLEWDAHANLGAHRLIRLVSCAEPRPPPPPPRCYRSFQASHLMSCLHARFSNRSAW